jgi:excisionase family DNA binding protein
MSMDVIEPRTELLTVEEAAEILRIGRAKVSNLMAHEELPVIRMGRAVRIPRRGFLEWIEAAVQEHS